MNTKNTRPVEQDLYDYSVGNKPAPTDDKYKQLIEMMMTDKNYSVAKEKITCYLAGVNHNPAKHDYDGRGLVDGIMRPYEVKPTTYWGTPSSKLRMKCSFADYTDQRLRKDRKQKPIIVVSGFHLTRLVYAVSFDFNAAPFVGAMEQYMQEHMEGDMYRGQRLIPAPDIRDIMKIPKDEVNVLYPSSMEVIRKNETAMNGNVFKFFEEHFRR